jgi:hypothetical protein
MNAFVTKQNPAKNDNSGQPNYIRAGESVDLWLTQTNPMDSTGGAFMQ